MSFVGGCAVARAWYMQSNPLQQSSRFARAVCAGVRAILRQCWKTYHCEVSRSFKVVC